MGKIIAIIICRLFGHQYRNRVDRVCQSAVYCRRCARVFGAFDSPYARACVNLSKENQEWNRLALELARQEREEVNEREQRKKTASV